MKSEINFAMLRCFEEKLVGGAKIVWTHLKFEQNMLRKVKWSLLKWIVWLPSKSLSKRVEDWMKG